MTARLDSIAPDIARAIGAVSDSVQQTAALAAARLAVEKTGIKDLAVMKALTGAQTSSLEEVVVVLDSEYFRLQEIADGGNEWQAEVLAAFSRARAASAVNFVVSRNPVEAIYESIVAIGDAQEIRLLFAEIVGKQG